jgi:hypothetical protein
MAASEGTDMLDPPLVVYDACVLYPFHLRNLLIQLAVEGVVAARWTDEIHDEWIRSLTEAGAVSRERLLATRDLMKAVLPDADVRDYRRHGADVVLPDPNDRRSEPTGEEYLQALAHQGLRAFVSAVRARGM